MITVDNKSRSAYDYFGSDLREKIRPLSLDLAIKFLDAGVKPGENFLIEFSNHVLEVSLSEMNQNDMCIKLESNVEIEEFLDKFKKLNNYQKTIIFNSIKEEYNYGN